MKLTAQEATTLVGAKINMAMSAAMMVGGLRTIQKDLREIADWIDLYYAEDDSSTKPGCVTKLRLATAANNANATASGLSEGA